MKELLQEANYAEEMQRVEAELGACRVEGAFASFDGNEITYEFYPKENAVGAMVICHGFLENAVKFREMAYYFRHAGYAVFSITHRGHGSSYRKHPEDPSLTHVDRFDDYVRDLECFVEQVVKPHAAGLPLDLYAHSMGGAVAVLYLQRHPEEFRRAVLTAPMLLPRTNGIPRIFVRMLSRLQILLGRGDKMVFVSKPYEAGQDTFEKNSLCTSRARFDYYNALRDADPALQNTGASYRWINESLRIARPMQNRRRNAAIRTQICLFQADGEQVVWNEPQLKFLRYVPMSRLVVVPYARHEIYRCDNRLLGSYLENILEFLRFDRDLGVQPKN
jgi:lysophospholipase